MGHLHSAYGLIHAPHIGGVERLVATPLNIAGAPDPTVQLVGPDGNGTAKTWTDRQNGEVLPEAGSGSSLTYGEPGPGLHDLGIKGEGGKRLEADDNDYGALSTGDIVMEIFGVMDNTNGAIMFEKRGGATGAGYVVYGDGSGLIVGLFDGVDVALVPTLAYPQGTIFHDLVALDRSYAGRHHMWGVATGSTVDITAIGDITRASPFTVFDRGGSNQWDGTLFLLQIWEKAAGWLPSHDIASVAKERSALLLGHALLHNHGSLTPTTL